MEQSYILVTNTLYGEVIMCDASYGLLASGCKDAIFCQGPLTFQISHFWASLEQLELSSFSSPLSSGPVIFVAHIEGMLHTPSTIKRANLKSRKAKSK